MLLPWTERIEGLESVDGIMRPATRAGCIVEETIKLGEWAVVERNQGGHY